MSAARLAIEALRWSAGTWLLWRVLTCRPAGDGVGACTIVIPARDEESNLVHLLASLRQPPPPAEPAPEMVARTTTLHPSSGLGAGAGAVIVVDDHSTDDTAAVARRAGATVIPAEPLPPGWTGKSWACATGAEAAPGGGGALVFLDADTTLAPGGLDRILGEHARRGGLVSVQPFHVTQRPYESLSAFFNVVSMMGVGAFTPRRNSRPTGAFGPCLVCTPADYAAAGGHAHEDVRGQVVEDVALARRFSDRGLPVTVLGGRGTIDFRMYPGGVAQLVEGWTKNFASGASSTRPLTFALISLWLSGCISATWSLPAPVAGAVYLAYAAQLHWMLRRIGRFGWWPALAYPLVLVFFLVVFARSLVLTHVRKEVRWRGRAISTRP